jgi:hypothetical protein
MSIKIKKTGQKTIENYKTRVFSLIPNQKFQSVKIAHHLPFKWN